jgi:hypothetical protein
MVGQIQLEQVVRRLGRSRQELAGPGRWGGRGSRPGGSGGRPFNRHAQHGQHLGFAPGAPLGMLALLAQAVVD